MSLEKYTVTIQTDYSLREWKERESWRFEAFCYLCNKISKMKGTIETSVDNYGGVNYCLICCLTDESAEELRRLTKYVSGVSKA